MSKTFQNVTEFQSVSCGNFAGNFTNMYRYVICYRSICYDRSEHTKEVSISAKKVDMVKLLTNYAGVFNCEIQTKVQKRRSCTPWSNLHENFICCMNACREDV